MRLTRAILSTHRRDERLAAEAGIDGHHQDEVEPIEHVFDRLGRRRGIERDARLLAERADRLQRAVEMLGRLGVDGDGVRAGLGEGFEIGVARARSSDGSRTVLSVSGRRAATTGGPKVMLGTKWPSITSRWIQSAPAAAMSRTSWPSLEKSAARIDGARTTDRSNALMRRRLRLGPDCGWNAVRFQAARQTKAMKARLCRVN